MTEQAERYDRIAVGYSRWWGPIIAPAARTVVDEIADAVAAGATRILDVGTGTGTLALEIVRRWPDVRVTAVDPSGGMIEQARAVADAELTPKQRARLELRVAFAADLGLADGTVDAAVSSFVLQLVPSRPRALREVHRVLRPGGVFGWISWLGHDAVWQPDLDFDDALEEVGEEPRGWSDGNDDLRTPGEAANQMRRAGFSAVTARAGELVHPFDIDGYVNFMAEFDEEDLVRSLDPTIRAQFETALRRRLARRPAEDLAMRQLTVTVRGTRR